MTAQMIIIEPVILFIVIGATLLIGYIAGRVRFHLIVLPRENVLNTKLDELKKLRQEQTAEMKPEKRPQWKRDIKS